MTGQDQNRVHSQLDNVALADFLYGLPAVSRPIIREWFRSGHDVEWKADDSPVTMADKSVELALREALAAQFPDDDILGEEHADQRGTSGYGWVIDPIDGTTNFIRDLPGFSVSIAARVAGVDSVGVVHALVRSERFTATLGSGAFCNGEAIHVSEPVDLARAVLGTGFNYQPTVRAEQARLIADLLPDLADIRRFGGAAIDCCSVASGRLDAYYEVGVQDWDIAAGGLLVREAGGRTLDHRPDGPFVCGSVTIFEELVGRLGLAD